MWHGYNQCRSVNNRFYIAIKDSINNDTLIGVPYLRRKSKANNYHRTKSLKILFFKQNCPIIHRPKLSVTSLITLAFLRLHFSTTVCLIQFPTSNFFTIPIWKIPSRVNEQTSNNNRDIDIFPVASPLYTM